MASSVDVVAEEEVVMAFDVSVFIWGAPKVKEPHQILVLTMNISKNFHRSINSKNHGLCLEDICSLFSQSNNMLSSKCKVSLSIHWSRPLLWSKKVLNKKLMKLFDIFRVWFKSIKCYNLWCLAFLLLYFTFAHSNFHICFCQCLHRRRFWLVIDHVDIRVRLFCWLIVCFFVGGFNFGY